MTDSLTVFGTDYTGVTGIKAKGTGNGTLTYIRPQGTKSISANGTGIDVAAYASVDVAVEGGADMPIFTVTNGVATCNKTYAECMEYHSENPNVTYVSINDTFYYPGQAYDDGSHSSYIVYVFFVRGIPTLGLKYRSDGVIELLDEAPSATQATFTQNGTYSSGESLVWNEVTVNVSGTAPTLQSKTATPSEAQQTVTPDSGYDGLSQVTVGAISSTYVGSGIDRRSSADLYVYGATVSAPSGYYPDPSNITQVAIGTAGTPTATKGSVSNHSVSVTPSVTNTTGYITGDTKTGTAVTVSASELVSGTYTVDSSGTKDVTNYASASVASGGATASATKGSVSNHSVSVTPTVTRTAGWVSAGTANGTAVTVSASELVSGTKSITASGTTDVTNYASASVASGGATASATKGSVSNHSITVTPSVTRTAGYVTAGTANGTAVTVSASELVSGSETKTANGTYDVTNLASLVVAIDYSTIYTSSSNPTSSQGANGDIWLVTS